MPNRSTVLLAPSLVALLAAAAACSPPADPAPPLRLADLLASQPTAPRVLAEELTLDSGATDVPVGLPAAEISSLRVHARGDAPLVRLAWRIAGERRFAPYRALTFPVVPDGEDRVYDVDLRREPYWTGTVEALRFSIAEGALRVSRVEGASRGGVQRITSLRGLTVPTLPGEHRVEVTLPPDAPEQATFEAWIGLLPRFDHADVTARFRARVEPASGGEPVAWLDEELVGGGGDRVPEIHQRGVEGAGWMRVRRRVEVPPGGRVVLEATAVRGGEHPLPAGSALWGAPQLVPSHTPDGPNLLLVILDTVRADRVGAWGGDGGITPNLDALAADGVRFEEMLAPSPWTLPSVTTLLTGRPPQVHGAGRRIGDFAPTALGDAPATLAEELAARGLYTAAVYNNIYLNPSFGLEQGFDEYAWVEDDDAVIVDRALERLEEIRDRRHFLMVHLFGPHHPYEPPEELCRTVAGSFAPDYDGPLGCSAERRDVPTLDGEVPPERDRRWIEGLYRAEIAHTDRQLGRLLRGLEELGLRHDTVVVVVSDHGEAFWDRLDQMERDGYALGDHGHTHYRELLRVPAVISAPGLEPATLADPVELADVFPTSLSLLGFAPPPSAGIDLTRRLAGEPPARRALISDFLLYGPARRSLRRGPWKLVAPVQGELGSPDAPPEMRPELYHLADDPGERDDRAADHPRAVAELCELLEREVAEREALRSRMLAGESDVLSSAYLEWNHITKLRALGYLK